jgi:hypothetical protein
VGPRPAVWTLGFSVPPAEKKPQRGRRPDMRRYPNASQDSNKCVTNIPQTACAKVFILTQIGKTADNFCLNLVSGQSTQHTPFPHLTNNSCLLCPTASTVIKGQVINARLGGKMSLLKGVLIASFLGRTLPVKAYLTRPSTLMPSPFRSVGRCAALRVVSGSPWAVIVGDLFRVSGFIDVVLGSEPLFG